MSVCMFMCVYVQVCRSVYASKCANVCVRVETTDILLEIGIYICLCEYSLSFYMLY